MRISTWDASIKELGFENVESEGADHRTTISCSSESEVCDARVSPSQDWLSSTGLLDPDETEDEDPTVHSSLLSFRKSS